jgi:hypothetical protein
LANIPKDYLEKMTEYFKQIKGGVTDLGQLVNIINKIAQEDKLDMRQEIVSET